MEALFIDWYMTLSTSQFWERRPGSRLTPTDLARVEHYVFNQPGLVREWMLGSIASEEVCERAANGLDLRPKDVLADLAESCRTMALYDPSVIETLRSLGGRGIRVVLATDNMDTFARWTVPALHLDAIFDEILTSASRGALKADVVRGQSAFFEPWLSDHGMKPSETVLVDDCAVPAVEAIGMEVRVVDHPSKLAEVLAELGKSADPSWRRDQGLTEGQR
jgi:FMN phosphatase YigB (HAD superfamily)